MAYTHLSKTRKIILEPPPIPNPNLNPKSKGSTLRILRVQVTITTQATLCNTTPNKGNTS